jgi:hypothetical protein
VGGVYSSKSNATKAQDKFYKTIWEDMYDTDWPGFKKADISEIADGGTGAWVETRTVRQAS